VLIDHTQQRLCDQLAEEIMRFNVALTGLVAAARLMDGVNDPGGQVSRMINFLKCGAKVPYVTIFFKLGFSPYERRHMVLLMHCLDPRARKILSSDECARVAEYLLGYTCKHSQAVRSHSKHHNYRKLINNSWIRQNRTENVLNDRRG